MSEQKDAFLQMAASYNFDTDKTMNQRSKTIDPQNFQKWTKEYMYTTTYGQYHSKESVNPKSTAIPGYTGYIPSAKVENIHAKTFSATAKESFAQDKLGKNIHGLSTTGLNLNREALIDRSKVASSSKYGKSSLQRAHPGWNANQWKSTTHQHFKDPGRLLSPSFRPTDKFSETWKPMTKSSGFARNNAQFDGHGWNPHPALKGDNHRTEYRDRYDADHPFHRDVNVSKPPKIPKKELNYRFT